MYRTARHWNTQSNVRLCSIVNRPHVGRSRRLDLTPLSSLRIIIDDIDTFPDLRSSSITSKGQSASQCLFISISTFTRHTCFFVGPRGFQQHPLALSFPSSTRSPRLESGYTQSPLEGFFRTIVGLRLKQENYKFQTLLSRPRSIGFTFTFT